ncbi:MAG: PA0069 family radical SAM protein [Pseudomonadota bacterium]
MRARSIKGRGIADRPDGRFARRTVDVELCNDTAAIEYGAMDKTDCDGSGDSASERAPETELIAMTARGIISRNSSPDIPFDAGLNPYQGCEHGCVYCYARPSHSYLDLSPGVDFETKIYFKENAADRLLATWQKPSYVPEPISIGANTDPYQPAEKSLGITRELLALFLEYRHPVSVITKGTLIERDLDLLAALADRQLCSVAVSIPTADNHLKRTLEPRVPAAAARFRVVERLAAIGVPVSVMMAPVIPALNDNEIEAIVARSASAGATAAAWILLRLPHELKSLFADWLELHYPDRAQHVMSLIRQASGGKDYDNRFGVRQRGTGAYAGMLNQRFRAACSRHGLNRPDARRNLDCTQFIRPGGKQISLPL